MKKLFYFFVIFALTYSITPVSSFAGPPIGKKKIPCILVSFADTAFYFTRDNFDSLLNKPGYSYNSAHGSVHDYFKEASYGKLDLTYDVYGPYTLSQGIEYYGKRDGLNPPDTLAAEAIALADADIDYSKYDDDGDGVVPSVYIIYAGSDFGFSDSDILFLPHVSGIPSYVGLRDGVSISRYGCSGEKLNERIDGIGIICHESAHLLGAPDFYDVDGEGSGGGFLGTDQWDLMGSGNRNEYLALPAHPNPYVKKEFNWATFTLLDSTMENVVLPNSAENPVFYYFNTPTPGEYFILENKSRVGFDSAVPGEGLLIYHVSSVVGTAPNFGHPQRMYPVCAAAKMDPDSTPESYGIIGDYRCLFPGTGESGLRAFTPFTLPSTRSWAGDYASGFLTNIRYNKESKLVTFDFSSNTLYDLELNALSSSELLTWWKSVGNKNVVISVANTYEDVKLSNGTIYSVGNTLGSQNKIVFVGPANEFLHSGLEPSTHYLYHIWTQLDAVYSYSEPDTISGTTKPECNTIYNLPFVEEFTPESPCWVNFNYNYKDTKSAWIFNVVGLGALNGDTLVDLVSPILNVSKYDSVRLSFKYYFHIDEPVSATVSFSLDSGKTWDFVTACHKGTDSIATFIIPTNGQPGLRVKWHYQSKQLYNWGIRSVKVEPVESIKNIITICAKGTQGSEHINLLINGSAVGSGWNLSTTYQNYTYTVYGDGDIQVGFDNDASGRDVQVDYILVNGEKRQAENMTFNSGFYANGKCGGGSKSEWLNCNGVIGFGKTTEHFGEHTLVIRARGIQGGEHINLLINGSTIGSGWTLTTGYQEYTAKVNGDGNINVQYDNDATGRDVQIDWLKVNIQEPRQAENMQYNTGFFANGKCGGGEYSEWLHCNGVIGFGKISANSSGGSSSVGSCSFSVPLTSAFPSLNKQYNYMHVLGGTSTLSNVNKFTIQWSLPNKGLYDISYNTSNGTPNWYVSLMGKVTQTLASPSPSITISGSGIGILDGSYWVTMDGDNLVMVSKTGGYAIYCSNSATAPCSSLKSAPLSVFENETPVITIYPNPSSGSVYIAFEKDKQVTADIKILDALGRIVYSQTCTTNEVVPVDGLSKGIYIVNIHYNGNVYNKILIVN
jgi:M6 family metalloprotease-like protein